MNVYKITIEKEVTGEDFTGRTKIPSTIIYSVLATEEEIGSIKRTIINLYGKKRESNNVGTATTEQSKTTTEGERKTI
jgi:predicted transcriptional regulator